MANMEMGKAAGTSTRMISRWKTLCFDNSAADFQTDLFIRCVQTKRRVDLYLRNGDGAV